MPQIRAAHSSRLTIANTFRTTHCYVESTSNELLRHSAALHLIYDKYVLSMTSMYDKYVLWQVCTMTSMYDKYVWQVCMTSMYDKYVLCMTSMYDKYVLWQVCMTSMYYVVWQVCMTSMYYDKYA